MPVAQVEDNSVQLYPNPFAKSFSLHISNPELINEICVVNQTGKVMLRLDKSQISENMQIGNELPSGMYIVKIVSRQNTNTYKIIKK